MAETTVRRSPVHDAVVLANEPVIHAADAPRHRPRRGLRDTPSRRPRTSNCTCASRGGRRVKRRYTVRARPAGDGRVRPRRRAARRRAGRGLGRSAPPPATRCSCRGRAASCVLRPAAWHLLVGDESALPAIACIVRGAAAGRTGDGRGRDRRRRRGAATLGAADVHWQHRDGRAPGTPDLLTPAVAALALPPAPGTPTCWARPAPWWRCARCWSSAASRTRRSSSRGTGTRPPRPHPGPAT